LPRKKYASSTDVARLAGVSQSAVSRTYKDGASVSEETRRKVVEAAKQLGYRPSLIPRIMLTHRSNLVAIVIGGMYNPFYSAVLEEFTVKLQETGHQALLVHVDSGHSLDAVIPRLASYRVDAIVSALAVLSLEAATALAEFNIPVISFNTPVKNKWVSSVCCDNEGAGRQIADHFIERGARAFAYLAGPSGSPANEERLKGYRDRLREHGVTELAIAGHEFHYEGGIAAIDELFRSGARPDAIFCANDLVAMGAMDSLRETHGFRVPEDVMIAGFDNIPSAAWLAYDLTTFVHDASLMVKEALDILNSMEGATEPTGVRTVIPARLVERRSTQRRI